MATRIKIYKVKSFVYTPFCDEKDLAYLNKHGIYITEDIKQADLLISQNYKHLKKYIWSYFYKKKYLVWTLEPRFDTHFSCEEKLLFGIMKCHFMNIYTEDVFTTGLTFHSQHISQKLQILDESFQLKNRKTAALMSYFGGIDAPPLFRNGIDIDLIRLRNTIALEGFKMGIADIYGKGWPQKIAVEDSRMGNWKLRKEEILKNYSFNLCFENTVAKNYITEKIWDSIQNYCLPIYYGKNNIYEIFPTKSFIDYTKFKNPSTLFKFIQEMSEEEYKERMNKCIEVYNGISGLGEDFVWEERRESLNMIAQKIHRIVKKWR